MKRLAGLLFASSLAGCSPAAGPSADAPPPEKTLYGFDVQLTLTPRTAEKLAGMGEMVTVSAVYHGEPKPGVVLDEEGMMGVALGEDRQDVKPENQLVVVTGKGFDEKAMADVEGPPQILLNIYSARKAHQDNIIWCGIYEGPVEMARQKPIAISCDLLEQ